MIESAAAQFTAGGARMLTGTQIRWLGSRPGAEPSIYFANHTSHMDFVLVYSALPVFARSKTRPVAAGDYWSRGIVRHYISQNIFHAVLIERTHVTRVNHPVEPMLDALDHGESLVLFPEGTRGTGEELQPFKCGIFHVAKARPCIKLIPVWIENACRVMPKGAMIPIPSRCSVTFGAPTSLLPGETREAFLMRLRQALADLAHQ